MPIKGNVVKFGSHDDLYVVAEAENRWERNTRTLESAVLIPFNHANSSIHVSRKNPFMTNVYKFQDCANGVCSCHGECEMIQVPCEQTSIDNIVFVADTVEEFVMGRMKKMMLL